MVVDNFIELSILSFILVEILNYFFVKKDFYNYQLNLNSKV